MRQVTAVGLDAVELATLLLQRARLSDPVAGLWEAADVQWWWRSPRRSDEVEETYWLDDEGPVAGVLSTTWADDTWQFDPLVVRGAPHPSSDEVWQTLLSQVSAAAPAYVEVPTSDDDPTFSALARESGLVPGEQSSTAWMMATDRPAVIGPPSGFTLVDRDGDHGPHPMRARNGAAIADRLAEGSLYDPRLDLSVRTTDGESAGYTLCWHDPVTRVGLIEPVRVEDAFQRRGLARVMLTNGVDRLAALGIDRIKIGFGTDEASALYQSLGFRPTSSGTWYARPESAP